jgi:hypothetical protein
MDKKNKLRPCDCKDRLDAYNIQEQGIAHNDESIVIEPNVVVMTLGHTTIRIPMDRFKMFAEWYLKPQETKTTYSERFNYINNTSTK